MNRNGRGIIQPNAMNIETTYAEGPLAQPLCVTMQGPGVMKILALSGLTKVEALSGQVFDSVVRATLKTELADSKEAGGYLAQCVGASVDVAEAILAECARRARSKKEIAT